MLGYRSAFTVDLDASVGIAEDNAVDALLGEGFRWLRKDKRLRGIDDLEPLREQTFSNGARAIYIRGARADIEYGKLIYFDPPQDAGQWVTSLLIGFDHGTKNSRPMIALDIDVPPDPRADGRPMWSNRPKLIQRLLQSYACVDSRMRLVDEPTWLKEGDGVNDFISDLQDEQRRGLIIACAEDKTVDQREWDRILRTITAETAGQASVVILDSASTEMYNSLVSPGHRLAPYSPRTFRLSVDIDDPADGLRHRTLAARTMLEKDRAQLQRMYGRICREHGNAVPLSKFLRRLDVTTGWELDVANRPASAVVDVPAVRMPENVPSIEIHAVPAVSDEAQSVVVESLSSDVGHNEADARVEHLNERIVELESALARRDSLETELREALDKANTVIRSLEEERDEVRITAREEAAEAEIKFGAQIDDLKLEMMVMDEESRSREKSLRACQYQLEQARKLLGDAGIDASGTWSEPEDKYIQELEEWEEIIDFGDEKFPNLILACDWEATRSIAAQDSGGLWFQTTWDILAMLDEYCNFRKTPEGKGFNGGIRQYLDGGAPAGARLVKGDRFRANESDTVKNSKKMGAERRFSVPKEVDPSGACTMLAHFVIQTRGSISPRLYFADRTNDLGKVVVGYIGKHLTNTKTT